MTYSGAGMLCGMTHPGALRPHRSTGRVRRLVWVGVLLVSLGAYAGCGAAPQTAPPSGVDGLVIPTPSPDPSDFVTEVDNPWLPLAPGNSWTYHLDGLPPDRTQSVEVLGDTRVVAGVEATQVRTRTLSRAGRVVGEQLRWFAQDWAGNVWALGELGVWEAGVGQARAGLAMPATPRLGDGFVLAETEAGQQRVRIIETGVAASVQAGEFTELLHTLETTAAQTQTDVFHARGVGEVLRLGPDQQRIELVEYVVDGTTSDSAPDQ